MPRREVTDALAMSITWRATNVGTMRNVPSRCEHAVMRSSTRDPGEVTLTDFPLAGPAYDGWETCWPHGENWRDTIRGRG
jgi:hypothetical protein